MHTSMQEMDVLVALHKPLRHLAFEVVCLGKKQRKGHTFHFGEAPTEKLAEFVCSTISPADPTYHVTYWHGSVPVGRGMAWPVGYLCKNPEAAVEPVVGVFAFAGHTYCPESSVKVTFTDLQCGIETATALSATILCKNAVEDPTQNDISLLAVTGSFGEQLQAAKFAPVPDLVRKRIERDAPVDVVCLALLPDSGDKETFYEVYELLNPFWTFKQRERRQALAALRGRVPFGRTCWVWGELRSTFGRHSQRLHAIRKSILDRLSTPDDLGTGSTKFVDEEFIHLHTVLCNMSAEADEIVGLKFPKTGVLDPELIPEVQRHLRALMAKDLSNFGCTDTAVGLMTISAGCNGARVCLSTAYLEKLCGFEPVATQLQARELKETVSAAREHAKQLFEEQQWTDAAQLYTDLIAECTGEEKLVMLSNRSQTFLQLGNWQCALHDAIAAIGRKVNNSDLVVKCWHRRASAEISLGDYGAAQCSLEHLPPSPAKELLQARIPDEIQPRIVQTSEMLCIGHVWGVQENTNTAIFQLITPGIFSRIAEEVEKLATKLNVKPVKSLWRCT
eukprot:TRINITY_DN16496_c0_g1_i1.p1 TRINITY_DN16496_c0_g1~~TRINITY_DN16496_c0_g1_i1.p1  ORF type:complete len:562 (+),score=90.32 TRINITY_DN16496_c0_g1_i1:25-1710(+)